MERQWKPGELLQQYNSQNKIKRGFRLLKDPKFFADSVFVSKNEPVKSLLMMMTLSLAVYNGLEWKLLDAMKRTGIKIKNQIGKPTDKITLSEVFWEMHRVLSQTYPGENKKYFYHVTKRDESILAQLGETYASVYRSIS